jgi:hypothetical protein
MVLDTSYKNESVSTGTLFVEDLADNCLRFLMSLDLDPTTSERLQAVEQRFAAAVYLNNGSSQMNKKRVLCKSMFKILEDISPEGCFFGPHPGEPGMLGFWDESLRFSNCQRPV